MDIDKLLAARRALDQAGRGGACWRVAVGRVPDAPLPGGPYDTIFLIDVLHYADVDAQRRILSVCASALRRNGVLWVRDAAAVEGDAGSVGRGERVATAFGFNPRGATHFVDPATLRASFGAAGLEVVGEAASGLENRLYSLRRRDARGQAGEHAA